MKKSIGAKTIIYPAPILIVGTYDKTGEPNDLNCNSARIFCPAVYELRG